MIGSNRHVFRAFGAIMALAATLAFGQLGAEAQAVASIPAGIYEGTCTSETVTPVTDLEPLVPTATLENVQFVGSDEAVDTATSTTSLNITFADLMAAGPLAVLVASDTTETATELACGAIGGFLVDGQITFGIDDVNGSGSSGIGAVSDDGQTVTVTIFLGEFPAEAASTSSDAGSTAADEQTSDVAPVSAPHGPPVADDQDGDGLADADETTAGTDPGNPDSDGDALGDGLETQVVNSNPLDPNDPDVLVVDADGDGLPVEIESSLQTDPAIFDTDGDGIGDGVEFFLGDDPLDANIPPDVAPGQGFDPDNDGLPTRSEIEIRTDPANPDTDFDGATDGEEVAAGTNPLNAGSRPS